MQAQDIGLGISDTYLAIFSFLALEPRRILDETIDYLSLFC